MLLLQPSILIRFRTGVGETEKNQDRLRACLHGGGGPQIAEVTCDGSPHLSL